MQAGFLQCPSAVETLMFPACLHLPARILQDSALSPLSGVFKEVVRLKEAHIGAVCGL